MKKVFVSLILVVSSLFWLSGCQDESFDTPKETQIKNLSTQKALKAQSNWDWTNSASFDYVYIAGLGQIRITSPFATEASADVSLTNIIRGKDYLPSQGWVLLAKNFGSPDNYMQTKYPYFMLYNKYRSLIRVFIFNNNEKDYKKAIFTVNWDNGTDKNSLFAPSEVTQSAVMEYHNGNKTGGTILNYITNYYSRAWFITDIPVTFDPNIDYTKNYVLRFRLANQIDGDLNIVGEYHFDTNTVTTNASNHSSSGRDSYSFVKDGQKFLSTIPTTDEMDKYFKHIENGLDPNRYKGHKKLQNTVTTMRNSFNNGSFKKSLSSISAVSSFLNGTLGAGLSILSGFFGKSNSEAITAVSLMPLVTEGTSSLKGTVTVETNATSFPLQLPGCNHIYGYSNVNVDGLPLYDNPLGVISLEKTPRLASKEETLFTHCDFDRWSGSMYSQRMKYSTYQMSDDITLAFNAKSNTEIMNIKARLVVEHQSPYVEGAKSRYDNITKFVTDKIVSGEYELLENNENSFRYGTPLVDIKQFKNTEILVSKGEYVNIGTGEKYGIRLNNPLYLQLMITLKPTENNADQTPIIYNVTYQLSKFNQIPAWSNESKSNALVLNKYFQ